MNWWDRFWGWWDNPFKVIGGVFLVSICVDSIAAVWGERRPVGGFFEEFIARAIHWSVVIGAFFGAIFGGARAFEATDNKVVGWVTGVGIFFLFAALVPIVVNQIPGVDWRYERLLESDY